MAPTIILIRHAEALHNITKDYTTPDPPLTPHGLTTQCAALTHSLKSHPLSSKIQLILTSPLTRTLQTTTQALSFLNVPIIALAQLQETTTNAIDIGTPLPLLKPQYPTIDWTHLDPLFPSKEGIYAFSSAALLERGKWVREWLANREEEVIAVVGHAGFLRIGLCNCAFGNADWRVFELEEKEGGDGRGPVLVEWEETERGGGGRGVSERGFFRWEVSDFKYMPGNEGIGNEELERLCRDTPLR